MRHEVSRSPVRSDLQSGFVRNNPTIQMGTQQFGDLQMPNLEARILVVDDHGTSRMKMSMAVRALGHDVETATNGVEALEAMTRQNFDLLLLDIEMPELDGYGVLKEMRKTTQLTHLPVIVISAVEKLDRICAAIELGAEDYLPKNFNPILLRSRIAACLEKKRWRDQEIAYLLDVSKLTLAAASLDEDKTDLAASKLGEVEARDDELGNLARVFRKMAEDFLQREQVLKETVQNLQIRIDTSRQNEKVTQITGTAYFKDLRTRADDLRTEMTARSETDDGA